ncbi:hypothetical protein HHL11_04135 [Ramlibacter sp. G-1-2-2]|uniref:Flagellar FliJ protein n=1 Tax=Ramlibacter agri TaxID=2728837 RepID=A0A848GXP7_9BURK|nr:hypothetical protein [Ramlibacter agri]NML42927.1 hypothetical protein [Ramlibacter agri]
MRFQWKLFPLQRKLEWDLDLSQGRLAVLQRGGEDAAALLTALEGQQSEQVMHVGAQARMQADPGLRAQALAYLCAMEARIAQARAQEQHLQREIAQARAECLRCRKRLDAMERLRGQAAVAYWREEQRMEAKEADLAWLARRGSQSPGERG